MDEGPNPDSAELCVVISNLPAQGLQCDLVATLIPMGGTAGKYCNQQGKVLYVVREQKPENSKQQYNWSSRSLPTFPDVNN